MSAESRLRRFLVPKNRLSEEDLCRDTECDGTDRYGIIATYGQGINREPEWVGAVHITRDENDRATGELAIIVADRWQRRGLGRQLLECISAAAAERRIRRIRAFALTDNLPLRRLLEGHAVGVDVRYLDGLLLFEVPVASAASALIDRPQRDTLALSRPL